MKIRAASGHPVPSGYFQHLGKAVCDSIYHSLILALTLGGIAYARRRSLQASLREWLSRLRLERLVGLLLVLLVVGEQRYQLS
jgi:hypothetical protein